MNASEWLEARAHCKAEIEQFKETNHELLKNISDLESLLERIRCRYAKTLSEFDKLKQRDERLESPPSGYVRCDAKEANGETCLSIAEESEDDDGLPIGWSQSYCETCGPWDIFCPRHAHKAVRRKCY